MTRSRFAKRRAEHIEAAREKYVNDFRNIPLAHAKFRVLALQAIYHNAESHTVKIQCLREIREEMAGAPVDPSQYQ